MGDRRSAVVEHNDKVSVALYTHWAGSELPGVVADALDRARDRWNDAPYLTRVLFAQMVKDDPMGTSGYGIEPVETGSDEYTEADQGYDIYVDVRKQQVYDGDETTYSFGAFCDAYRTT